MFDTGFGCQYPVLAERLSSACWYVRIVVSERLHSLTKRRLRLMLASQKAT